jgi:hypothetical protein
MDVLESRFRCILGLTYSPRVIISALPQAGLSATGGEDPSAVEGEALPLDHRTTQPEEPKVIFKRCGRWDTVVPNTTAFESLALKK